jgi:hypothetical protein
MEHVYPMRLAKNSEFAPPGDLLSAIANTGNPSEINVCPTITLL